MIITNEIAKKYLKEYSNKDTKLSREVRDSKLIKIMNGLYETDINTSNYLLAGSIYGPSYISFEYALSFYRLIPERVSTVTCATFDKKKKKSLRINLEHSLIEIFQFLPIPKRYF